MQHFNSYPTADTFACDASAVGRRHTRKDVDPALTTCRTCRHTPEWVAAAEDAGIDANPDNFVPAL